ncbi:sensor histidine kinase [Devosia sp. SL43]|uniref:sensor histidine kinase n=1 Tax=Devosia sp. SL43 TaxID=2806348 RepID=UPI001F3D5BF3|nr:sensor histidine kinase [Devosia sp. SL43]UJW86313.1 sensor histidine kinase [Devosia sp. SL43]
MTDRRTIDSRSDERPQALYPAAWHLLVWTKAIWHRFDLAAQFLAVGALVLLGGMLAIGIWVTGQIEQGVIANSAAATALYVDSVVSPLFDNFTENGTLSEGADRALDEVLGQGTLGERLVVFKIWLPDGSVAYSSDPAQIGQRFPIGDHLREAFAGAVTAEFDQLADAENAPERGHESPLLEIYSPVRQAWSGEIIAVAEFYENADGLAAGLAAARLQSWAIVSLTTSSMLAALYLIVRRGSKLIDRQRRTLEDRVGELSDLLVQNQLLRGSLQAATDRSLALNEQFMRRVGADLHDGPAQLLALAQMRLGRATTTGGGVEELDQVRGFLGDAMAEIRSISRGLVLPEVETLALPDLLRSVVATHEERTGNTVELLVPSLATQLDRVSNICIYRFVQESLSNASRHANGVGLRVEVEDGPGSLVVTVRDRGPGFDTSEPRTGLGLEGMRERIASLGGRMDISSSPLGTSTVCTLPKSRSTILRMS